MEWRGSNPELAEVVHLSLAERLAAITKQVEELVPAAKLEPPRRAVQELLASGAAERALRVGDRAPAFVLTDTRGAEFILTDHLLNGPVVLVFYRGRWCPYCIAQLEELERARPEFEKQIGRAHV